MVSRHAPESNRGIVLNDDSASRSLKVVLDFAVDETDQGNAGEAGCGPCGVAILFPGSLFVKINKFAKGNRESGIFRGGKRVETE